MPSLRLLEHKIGVNPVPVDEAIVCPGAFGADKHLQNKEI
jgi:hypothetical protein